MLVGLAQFSYAQTHAISGANGFPSSRITTHPNNHQEEDFIKPGRPLVATPAEIHRAGVLQLEYGYDVNFRANEFRTQQINPLTLRFAASSFLLLEVDLEIMKSQTEPDSHRETALGDTYVCFQIVSLKDTEQHPALAFAYYLKLPSADEQRKLGTGRYDHKVVALLSKKWGRSELDVNLAYLNVGREDSVRRASGGQGAIAFAYQFKNNFGLEAELSGQSLDYQQTRGVYAAGVITYEVNKRCRVDGGVRFGLNPSAPRFGIFAGVTIGVANLYKK
jgi:hypothetical protein